MAEGQAIRTMCNFDSCPGHNGVSSRTMNKFGDLAVVFRPTAKPVYGDAAGQLAVQMCGQVGYSSGVAGMGRALRVPFHTAAYTNKTAARLLKYDNRGQRPRNVICTELCVICYQLAIGNPHDPYLPRLDGKFLHPGELESYFLQNATYWSLVGKVTGPNAHG